MTWRYFCCCCCYYLCPCTFSFHSNVCLFFFTFPLQSRVLVGRRRAHATSCRPIFRIIWISFCARWNRLPMARSRRDGRRLGMTTSTSAAGFAGVRTACRISQRQSRSFCAFVWRWAAKVFFKNVDIYLPPFPFKSFFFLEGFLINGLVNVVVSTIEVNVQIVLPFLSLFNFNFFF